YYSHVRRRDLPSFPTRRSSDLLMLAKFGTPEQRSRWLPDLATGKRRSGIALTEPQAGSDLQGITTTARREGDHFVVNGAKTWIRSEEHTSELQSLAYLVCRLLL